MFLITFSVMAPGTVATPTCEAPECTPGGQWSEWNTGTCNDTCGLCGSLVRTRTCLSEGDGCPCDGSAEDSSTRCGTPICTYPKSTCCGGARRQLSGSSMICVPS